MDVSANKGVDDDAYVIGVDFGTLSARALVVRVRDGAEAGTAVSEYSHGVIDRSLDGHGELPPDWALQDPADYIHALAEAVPAAVRDAGIDPAQVIGIATDFTASTCMPVLADGTPLCQLPGLAGRPHAYPKLWKHHAAQPHADRINAVAHERGEKWINRYGGKISSEWQFAKALQLLDEDPEMYQRADRWIEAADWIVWHLCGVETRNACTAGYKAQFQEGRYPNEAYLQALNPELRRDTTPRGEAYNVRVPSGKGKELNAMLKRVSPDRREVARVISIAPGEDLQSVANRTGVSVATLQTMNAGVDFKSATKLVIPNNTVRLTNWRRDPVNATETAKAPTLEKVRARKGDTIAKIAAAHKLSTDEVARLNGIAPNADLKAGQEIKLPGASSTGSKRR
jgi:LysM repeat protein